MVKIHVLSDPEGFEISAPKDNTKLYICGDITDSTTGIPSLDINTLQTAKSYNLKNIEICKSNKNIKLFFGNRDINKLKVKYLAKLKSNSNKINDYNTGNIDLSFTTYIELKKDLNKDSPFVVDSMNAWYTFWSDGVGAGKKWNEKADYSSNPFLVRFNEIFGIDNKDGTMSAQNLLYTIPYEVAKNNNKIDLNNNTDYYAFIVLAIYRSMLLKSDNNSSNYKGNSSNYKGYLYDLFINNDVCACECFCNKNNCSDCRNVYIFSHGGITNKIMQHPELLTNNSNNSFLTDFNKYIQMNGGSNSVNMFSDIKTPLPLKHVKETITYINNTIKKSIKNLLDIDDLQIPNDDMLFLLKLSAPYYCDIFKSKLKVEHKSNYNCDPNEAYDLLSPILPGIRIMREEYFFIEDKNVYQFFGHQPNGFGTSIDKFSNGASNSYLINLDVSLSFSSTMNNTSFENTLNINMVTIENDNIKIESNINHNINIEFINNSNIDIFNIKNKDPVILNKLVTDYKELTNPINTSYLINDVDDILIKFTQLNDKVKELINNDESKENNDNNVYYNFNGIINNKYILFNISEKSNPKRKHKDTFYVLNRPYGFKFGKTYYVLSDELFNNQFEKILLENNSYKSKYLKYKQKYLQLKNQLKN